MDEKPESLVEIETEIAAKLNFAAHQSSFSVLRSLRVLNLSPTERLEEVVLRLQADPPFFKERVWQIDRIEPDGSLMVRDRELSLDGGLLLNLSESVSGTAKFTVEKDETVLFEIVKPVELLAYNEWGGAAYMPELLASFVTPNDPAVDRLLHGASKVLRQAGRPDAIDGYRSGKRERVWEIAASVYSAISGLGLSYVNPPASFEKNGQKIRLPGQILEGGVATCLDTSVLFAAAFEQAGLNPVIVTTKGHAFVGVWLQPEGLSSIVADEAETLRKRADLDELVLIETTCITNHPAPPFSKAISLAREKIHPDLDDEFGIAIDIQRARAHRITPLGLKTTQSDDGEKNLATIVEHGLEKAPALPSFDTGKPEEDLPETPKGRLENWQRRLLDLTLNNRLLNHRSSKSSLRLICPSPGLLEDKIAAGGRIEIRVVPKPTSDEQDQELHKQRTGEIITEEYARDALERNQVLVDLNEEELSKRAVDIFRKSRAALQEGGANTLYLALGFLIWKRDIKDERRLRAPLILLPVTLERKSVRSGIKLMSHDDEPRFNTTLLEMLRKDFSINIKGLDGTLPEDHSGIDVKRVWDTVRLAVKDAPGFEVVEEVVLGQFSFAKYLMWKDLVDRTDVLRENTVVRHLLDTPRDAYPSEIGFVEAREIDRQYKPSDLLTPLPADSSQIAAIATAARGKNFVIIGPPGTGKSQTIANLIAHMLGTGKTVLFISEKTAALEVVYRRLDDAGLGRFCLELHSNRARKVDVLGRLRQAWEGISERDATEWESEAERLRELRDRLNLVVDRLHLVRRNGLTAHQAIGVKVRDEEIANRVRLSWPSADHHDEAFLTGMRETVGRLEIQAKAIGDVSASPFHLVEAGNWSPDWEGRVADCAAALSAAVTALDRACDSLCDAAGVRLADRSLARIDAVADLARILIDSYRKETHFALEPDGPDRIEALAEASERLAAYRQAADELICPYEPFAWRKLDGQEVARQWMEAENTWWPKRFFARRKIIKQLRSGGAKGRPEPGPDAQALVRLRQEGEALDRLDGVLAGLRNWSAHGTEPGQVDDLRQLGERARSAIGRLADDPAAMVEIRNRIRILLCDGNDLLSSDAPVGRAARVFIDTFEQFELGCREFESNAGGEVRASFAVGGEDISRIQETADMIEGRRNDLRDWCAWRRRRNEAMDADLAALVQGVEKARIPADEIVKTFEAAYCTWWSSAVIGEDSVLRDFSTAEHMADIERFCETDTRFQKLTADYIAAKLSGELPQQDNVRKTSQWGLLRRELQKKRKLKPVRQLISEAPEVLTTLAPCFMMSPLSVAQYLPPEQKTFDVVIFDEASQITVWDAIGSIARGSQVIVAGDPKQMPPSNFFSRSDDDPDGDVDVEGDLESILDEMIGASIPMRTLNLHYRSRRESLIAFSNSRYYDNSLITFPAPAVTDHGVSLVRPDGFYARGKARHNEGEAKTIVAEVVERLTSNDLTRSTPSIGVVTFNSEQQNLIENLLDEARARHPSIEKYFNPESVLEPVFVKNLETVQGDERDVILFSVTYGPDQSGHVTMNFGPLNRQGGERRLNVALTRARQEMIVYAIIRPEMIDLSRSQARAVADLKHFLEYAERGKAALGEAVFGSVGDFESPLETAVARGLRDKGWQVHPQIGVSAYRIDLGVVDPDAPGRYLAGVECDGAMYHSSAYARERDKIRQGQLENLGWTLFRLWSTDWWTNRLKSLDELDLKLTEHLSAERERRAVEEAAMAAALEAQAEKARVSSEDDGDLCDPEPESEASDESAEPAGEDGVAYRVASYPAGSGVAEDQIRLSKQASLPLENNDTLSGNQYEYADLSGQVFGPSAEQFYDESYDARLIAMIDHVIDCEGPIHADMLVRRIARHHAFQRAGNQIQHRVIELAKRRRDRTSYGKAIFFWRKGTVKTRLSPARHLNRDTDLQKTDHICPEEIQAINETLSLSGDAEKIARAIGIKRVTSGIRIAISSALQIQDN